MQIVPSTLSSLSGMWKADAVIHARGVVSSDVARAKRTWPIAMSASTMRSAASARAGVMRPPPQGNSRIAREWPTSARCPRMSFHSCRVPKRLCG